MSKKCHSKNTIPRVKPTLFLVKSSQTEKLIEQPLQKPLTRFTPGIFHVYHAGILQQL
jgi:hypothetical protein